MTRRYAIGLSSGSGLYGVQAALVEAEGAGPDLRPTLVHWLARPYPAEVRALLARLQANEAPGARQTALAHRLLGEWFAAALFRLLDEARFDTSRIFCAGLAEQVVWHETDGRYPATLCLGMPEIIAEKTGLTVISQFRQRDLAAGGQGLPVTAMVDHLLLGHESEDRLLLHLGGWATLLYIPAKAPPRRMAAAQAAPCGMLLDSMMELVTGGKQTVDAWGKHAVQGRCIEEVLARWLSHPVLAGRSPRALRQEDFGEAFLSQGVTLARAHDRSMHDLLCTAAHFVARAIARTVERCMPPGAARVVLSGGGVKNGLLLRLLEQQLTPVPVANLEKHGMPAEARKAFAHAVLALWTLDGLPANVPAATGASGPRLLGTITPGATRNWARCLNWMAHQMAPFSSAAA